MKATLLTCFCSAAIPLITPAQNPIAISSKPIAPALTDLIPREIDLPDGKKLSAEFGWLKVPENRTKDDSKIIELPVMRIRSKATKPGAPFVYLAGGPGGSAISEARFPFMSRLFEQVLETRDVLLMDQRGTGQSKPAITWQATEPFPPDAFSSQENAVAFVRRWHQRAVESFRQRGIDLSGYNTIESADDINDLRRAVGAEKVSLLGFSYGSHLGLATIRRHSAHLDSTVLVGTEGPNHTFKLPSTYDAQLRKISDLAAQDPDVKNKVPDMIALLKKIFAKLEKVPVTLSVTNQRTKENADVQIGKFALQFFLRRDAGDSSDFVSFPALLYSIDKGDYTLLQQIAERRYNQGLRGISGMTMMMNLSSGATKERVKQVEREAQTALLGNVVNFPDMFVADLWGNPDLGDQFRTAFSSKTRTLFISGTFDSNTPLSQVEELRKGFTASTHLVTEYAGHEDNLPDPKVQAVIIDFLSGKDVSKRRIELPKPKFKEISD